jgi:hypothetical protein
MSGMQALGTNLLHAVDLAAADAASCLLVLFVGRHGDDAGVLLGVGGRGGVSSGVVAVRFPGDFVEFGSLDLHPETSQLLCVMADPDPGFGGEGRGEEGGMLMLWGLGFFGWGEGVVVFQGE